MSQVWLLDRADSAIPQADRHLELVKQHSQKGVEYYGNGLFAAALYEFNQALGYADRREDRDTLQSNIRDIKAVLAEETSPASSQPNFGQQPSWAFALYAAFFILIFTGAGLIIYQFKNTKDTSTPIRVSFTPTPPAAPTPTPLPAFTRTMIDIHVVLKLAYKRATYTLEANHEQIQTG